MQLLKSTGVLVYDPFRPGMKNTDWWIILNTDEELCRYYRWWIWRQYMVDLKNPSWGSHVSILRGAKPRADKIHFWKKYQREKIKFEYSPVVRQQVDTDGNLGHFWFIDVWSERLNDIRDELGFKTVIDDKKIKYHLTIGRTY